MIEINSETEFNKSIEDNTVLVDFFATWCGPCRILAPELEQVDSVKVVKVDIDKLPEVSTKYAIMSVPTLILLKDGKVIARHSGYLTKEMIEKWVNTEMR